MYPRTVFIRNCVSTSRLYSPSARFCLRPIQKYACMCFVHRPNFSYPLSCHTSRVFVRALWHPTRFLSQKALSKQARQHLLVSPPAHSALFYSLSPAFSVSARRDLVFLLLSVCSLFYCAIFCHFGPRKGGRNAISPLLHPLL